MIHPDTLSGFEDCPRSWCVAPHPYLRSEVYAGLGCIRFRAEFIAAHPDLMRRVAVRSDARHPQRHWCTCDAWIQRELGGINRACHNHAPVGHLHRRPSHDCVPVAYLDREGIPG